jgi:hypothetical protein
MIDIQITPFTKKWFHPSSWIYYGFIFPLLIVGFILDVFFYARNLPYNSLYLADNLVWAIAFGWCYIRNIAYPYNGKNSPLIFIDYLVGGLFGFVYVLSVYNVGKYLVHLIGLTN